MPVHEYNTPIGKKKTDHGRLYLMKERLIRMRMKTIPKRNATSDSEWDLRVRMSFASPARQLTWADFSAARADATASKIGLPQRVGAAAIFISSFLAASQLCVCKFH